MKIGLLEKRDTMSSVEIAGYWLRRNHKSWDSRAPMLRDNFSIFRTNCAILTSHIRADSRTCRGSRVDVVTLRDQMVRVERFPCVFFTAMAGNKAGNTNQGAYI